MKNTVLVLGLAGFLALALATVPGHQPADVPELSLSPTGTLPSVQPELILLPSDNPDETLHWDGPNANGIGLTNGGTYYGAARFTPTSTCTLKAALHFQRQPSNAEWIFIFGEGTDTTPGPVIESMPYTVTDTMVWKRTNTSRSPIITAGTDFWVAVRITHAAGRFPLGVDAGPMVRDRGGFISTGGGRWQQLPDVNPQLNYNWNIRAIIASVPGAAHDVGVSRIIAPGTSINPGSYQPIARVTNFGTNPESNIPVTCWIDSGATRIYNQTVTLPGPLQPGARAQVTFPVWNTGPSGARYTITMFTSLAGDLVPANDTMRQPVSIATGQALVDHDTGYCKLTVSCFGAIGYDNPPAYAGSGFCYPKTSASALFYSSFLIGNETLYVADRFFGRPASGPVNNDLQPVDSLMPVVPPQAGDEQFRASFNDRGHPTPKGIKVYQNSYMTALTGYDDFVVINYNIVNEGSNPVNGLYAGVWSDFDIGTNPAANTATSDTVRRLMYMRQSTTANPTVGTVILYPPSFRNLTAVDHARWVYPTDSCVRDAQKFRFLNGTVVQRNSNRPYDWSLIMSIGPFDLAPGANQRFAIAFVGGSDEATCRAHSDSAQSWYDANVGIAERPELRTGSPLLAVQPNPFRKGAWVNYNSPLSGRLELAAFDAAGREVERTAFDVPAGAGRCYWRPEKLSRGVYFVRITTPDAKVETKVLKLE